MQYDRAREIINTDETIEVLYHGLPVWLEELNPVTGTARVKPLKGGTAPLEVPLRDLVER